MKKEKFVFLPSNYCWSLILSMKLQNHKIFEHLAIKLFTSGHPTDSRMLFSYMDDTCQWGPYVRPLSPVHPLSPCHSSFSLLSLHCCLRCSSTPADHTMSSSARSWLSTTGSLNLGLLPSSAVRRRSTPLWITYVHCFSIEFDPVVSLLTPQRSFWPLLWA